MTSTLLLVGAMPELGLAVRATIIIGGAWASAALLQKVGASAAARHMAWLLGIAALLVLPLLSWLVPALQLPILPTEAAIASPAGVAPQLSPPETLNRVEQAGWSGVILIAYLLVAATLLLRIAAGRHMLAGLWRQARPSANPAWEELLSRLSLELGLARPVQLRIARGPAMPMTWGTLEPKLLLPAEASEWPPERRRLVLLHELAHVARRDSLSRSMASLACALYWFHPGAWFVARRMRMEQEHAADDQVLATGGSPRAYALSLLHLASRVEKGLRADLAATMAGTCQLERRLVSITGAARRDRPTPACLSASALIAGSATLVVAAGVPVSATPILPETLRAERTAIAAPARGISSGAEGPALGETRPPTRAARLYSASNADEFDRRSKEDAVASKPRLEASASGAGGAAERARKDAPGGSGEAESPSRGPSQAHSQQLSEYGWELRGREPKLEIDSSADPLRPARPTSRPRAKASKERTGLPKWAKLVPLLVLPNAPKRSSAASSDGKAMLMLSLDVGAP